MTIADQLNQNAAINNATALLASGVSIAQEFKRNMQGSLLRADQLAALQVADIVPSEVALLLRSMMADVQELNAKWESNADIMAILQHGVVVPVVVEEVPVEEVPDNPPVGE